MANFMEELWNSVFTPGTTPTLLVATNASFAALQLLLLLLFIGTYSIHFFVLSILSAGLWYAINWFAHELAIEKARTAAEDKRKERAKSAGDGSDTETESMVPEPVKRLPKQVSNRTLASTSTSTSVQPQTSGPTEILERRHSEDSRSGDVSTDSEWEKLSEGESKSK